MQDCDGLLDLGLIRSGVALADLGEVAIDRGGEGEIVHDVGGCGVFRDCFRSTFRGADLCGLLAHELEHGGLRLLECGDLVRLDGGLLGLVLDQEVDDVESHPGAGGVIDCGLGEVTGLGHLLGRFLFLGGFVPLLR